MTEVQDIVETDVERQIKEALSQGERWNIIAKTLHVSNRTIAKVSKKMNEPTSPPPPVSEVVKMFEEGKTPNDIIKEFNAEPETIEKWFNVWLNNNKRWREWQVFKAEHPDMAKASDKDDGGKETVKAEEKPRPDWRARFELPPLTS